jgi:hypothetical protein
VEKVARFAAGDDDEAAAGQKKHLQEYSEATLRNLSRKCAPFKLRMAYTCAAQKRQ